MTHYITAEYLVDTATKAVTEELFREFDKALQSFCNEERDRIVLFRMLRYSRIRLSILRKYLPDDEAATRMRWTGALVELVELIYGLQEMRCIDDGGTPINELFAFFGLQFGLEIKVRNCYDTYLDIKRRKNDSRTYFLDKMRERLNLRMQRDDEKERERCK